MTARWSCPPATAPGSRPPWPTASSPSASCGARPPARSACTPTAPRSSSSWPRVVPLAPVNTLEPTTIEEIRLTRFKTFRGAVLPLGPLTLLVGRNGSGKSNALDGLAVLSRLAGGVDVRDALDGRDGPQIRGGALGAPPFGESSFALGVTVRTGAGLVGLDVTIETAPHVQVVAETLWRTGPGGERLVLFETDPPRGDSADIDARWDESGGGEPDRVVSFRANRLLASQVLARLPSTTTGRTAHLAAAQVLAALGSVFVLDPVPHQMRQYVPRRDRVLRRNADNVSAAVAGLLEDPATRSRLVEALNTLNEQDVVDIGVSASQLDDVMLTVVERAGPHTQELSARLASDGTLRFLAVLAALLEAPSSEGTLEAMASDDAVGQTTLVIEELENGLHASQAAAVVGLIREEVHARRIRTLATIHSPAILDALTGEDHPDVVVCQRQPDGASTLTRLVDLPGYFRIVAAGSLGRAAEQDRLRSPTRPLSSGSYLDELLGAG
ncbi:MAG: AAA family ATPase [Acidimicrobiia bacterium]|nr:AAA family ATPase [Acidimicrobiia bacterium]